MMKLDMRSTLQSAALGFALTLAALGGMQLHAQAIAAHNSKAPVNFDAGRIELQDVDREDIRVIERPFRKLGVKWRIENSTLYVESDQKLEIEDDFGGAIPKIEDGIWPSFPSDLMSVLIVLATRAKGTINFFEKLFESRMFFVDKLISMGARIVLCDPHRVVVSGPCELHGTRMSSPDIRAGMALLLAGLAADGESKIGNAECIDRGYERIEHSLVKLGACICRQ